MNIDIFNIVSNRTNRREKLNLYDYKNIVDVIIDKNDLKEYINSYTIFTNKSGCRYILTKPELIDIDIDIQSFKKQPNYLQDPWDRLWFNNLSSLFPIFHEINHVIHKKRIIEDKNSIESKVLSLSTFGSILTSPKEKAISSKYHNLFIHERVANIEAISNILDLSSLLYDMNDKVHNEVLSLLMKYYLIGYDKYEIPSKVIFEKFDRLKIYEDILAVAKNIFIGEKIKYGLEVPKEEREYFTGKLYNKLKRI